MAAGNVVEKLKNLSKECYGCGACEQSCPCNAIVMQKCDEGFLYPQIDNIKCIECGLCIGVCQCITKSEETEDGLPDIYMVLSKDEEVTKRSSSGGIAYFLSEYIIKICNGVVFGAVYDKDMNVVHEKIEELSQIYRIQGSKYVQSRIGNTYKQAEECLKEGRVTLFTGTPCQIGGLHSYLGKEYSNLYTMDVVCFGVASPGVFEAYIKWKEDKIQEKIVNINFRDKRAGWGNSITEIECESGKKFRQVSQMNEWYHSFVKHLLTRESCHACEYTSIYRKSDITVGDFWGIERHLPKLDTSAGVSKVLINSHKGVELFDKIGDKVSWEKMSLEVALRPNLQRPPKKSALRDTFYEDYKKYGFYGAYKRYLKNETFVNKIKRGIQITSASILGADRYCKMRVLKKIFK